MAAWLSRWAWMTSITPAPPAYDDDLLAAWPPHTDESITVVGEARVADDGAQ
jgi:hypothetical protein